DGAAALCREAVAQDARTQRRPPPVVPLLVRQDRLQRPQLVLFALDLPGEGLGEGPAPLEGELKARKVGRAQDVEPLPPPPQAVPQSALELAVAGAQAQRPG